jgi:hypothetical protein
MSSQISTCSTKPGRSVAVNSKPGPNGTSTSPIRMALCRSSPGGELAAFVNSGRWAGTTSGPRRAPVRDERPPRCCRSGAGSATARRPRAPASAPPAPRRRRALHPRRHPATRPAAGCPRSSSRTTSVPGYSSRATLSSWQARASRSTDSRWPPDPPERRDACTRQPARSRGGRPSRRPSLSIVAFHVSTSGDGVETTS